MKQKFMMILVAILVTSFCGCGNVTVNKQSSDSPKSNVTTQASQQETISNTAVNKEIPKLHDGVYRIYSSGLSFQKGTVLKLQSTLLLQAMEQPVKTLIYLDNKLYKEIDFSNEDREIRLDENGHYWIIVEIGRAHV